MNLHENIDRIKEIMDEGKDAFVLGIGDHLQKNKENDFLTYIIRNNWWKENFYPTIADAENDYFGNGQGDWGNNY